MGAKSRQQLFGLRITAHCMQHKPKISARKLAIMTQLETRLIENIFVGKVDDIEIAVFITISKALGIPYSDIQELKTGQ